MRTDECGQPCPETLGEYLDHVKVIAPHSEAMRFLDDKIADAARGRDEIVQAADVQMRFLLFPMMIKDRAL